MLINIIHGEDLGEFIGVFKYENTLLASQIWILVRTRPLAAVVEREVVK